MVEIALRDELAVRDARWSEAVAVSSLAFVEKVKSELGIEALDRELEQVDGTDALRESGEAYRGQIDSKMSSKTRKHTFMGANYRSCGNLAWGDPAHISPENLALLLGLHDLTFFSVVE
jgi:hypothetical protein